jgi:hypothetical protein
MFANLVQNEMGKSLKPIKVDGDFFSIFNYKNFPFLM